MNEWTLFPKRKLKILSILVLGLLIYLSSYQGDFIKSIGEPTAASIIGKYMVEEAPTLSNTTSSKPLDVIIIYNAYLYEHWSTLIKSQLEDIVVNGLLENSTLYVTLSIAVNETTDSSSDYKRQKEELQKAVDLVKDVTDKKAKIEIWLGNHYEFPGILRLWKLGQQLDKSKADRTVFLYFHSKGMVYHPRTKNTVYKKFYRVVIEPWITVLDHFSNDDRLQLAGYAASASGFMWFNFFWVRGSRLRHLVRPIRADHRYYYEDFISRIDNPEEKILDSDVDQNFDLVRPFEKHGSARHTAEDCWSMCLKKYQLNVSFTAKSLQQCGTWW